MRIIKQNNQWYNQGSRRRKQIVNWLVEDYLMTLFRSETRIIKKLLLNGQLKDAYKQFNTIVDNVIDDGNTLGYLIKENEDMFGKSDVRTFLFGTIYDRFIGRIKKTKKKKISVKTQLAKDFIQQKQIRKFGLNKENKREFARLIVSSSGQFQLRSQKTGRILKIPDNLKQKLKNGGKI